MDSNKTNLSPEDKSDDASSVIQGDSLEYSDGETANLSSVVSDDSTSSKPAAPKEIRGPGVFKRFWRHFNIYLLVFLFIIILASVAITVVFFNNRRANIVTPGTINQQNLPANSLQELATTGVQVGDPKQVLNVQSNSVFAGAVLVKGELQVAGGLKIGSGSLAVPEVNVGGSAIINQLQTQSLGVANTARVGELSVLRNLNVNGSGSFNGGLTTPTLSVGRLQLNGDLSISRHIVIGGPTPGRTNGSALGGGGTSSVSGSDTAGSISINTGSSPAAGCFITVNFTNAFTAAPSVIVTPVGSSAAGIDYYINRSTGSFSVCSANSAPANSAFGFDYHAFD